MAKIKVGVLMGGPSSEHFVSLSSGKQVAQGLDKKKYQVFPILITQENKWLIKSYQWIEKIKDIDQNISKDVKSETCAMNIEPVIQKIKELDVMFICLHGKFGEDGRVQALLDLLKVPYTGSGVLASVIGLDKDSFKRYFSGVIRMPKSYVIEKGKTIGLPKIAGKLVVKPADQGSSVGVSIVSSHENLLKAANKAFGFCERVIVEEYIDGAEVSCGVLGNNDPFALEVVEIRPKGKFFDYKAKYLPGETEEIIPAKINNSLTAQVKDMAITVHKTLGCRGFSRTDMIVNDKGIFVLEINTIPGLTPNSLLPKEAKASGISYSKLLDIIISHAF
jgi:D-alanine-D-alanine ligase